MNDPAHITALLSAVAESVDLGGCTDARCTDPVCWIGCLDGEARTLVRQVLDELGAS